MTDIAHSTNEIKPTVIDAYVDRLHIWLKQPLKPQKIRSLGAVHVFDRPAGAYPQQLQLLRPTPEDLHWLGTLADLRISYAEFALDWVFNSTSEREAAAAFVDNYHLKRWHRKRPACVGRKLALEMKSTARLVLSGRKRV